MLRRGIAAAAMISLLLPGCGETGAPSKGAPEAPQVDTLESIRSDLWHQTVPERISVSISDTAVARNLYVLLVSMPPFPKNVAAACPADPGVRYHLVFLNHSQTVLSADADPQGCELVHLSDGRTLRAFPSSGSGPEFWSLFAQAVHLTPSQVQGVALITNQA